MESFAHVFVLQVSFTTDTFFSFCHLATTVYQVECNVLVLSILVKFYIYCMILNHFSLIGNNAETVQYFIA